MTDRALSPTVPAEPASRRSRARVGGRSARQVEGVMPAMHFRLGDEEYGRINRFLAENGV